MAESTEDLKTLDEVGMEVNDEPEPTAPDIAQAEINELMADDEVVDLMEGTNEEIELQEEKESGTEVNEETEVKEDDGEAEKNNENETEEFLDVSVDNAFETAFEADVLDDTAGDDEEGKENHEGDGEHEEMKDEEDEEEEEEEDDHYAGNQDPNVMPQVNVSVLAQRKWQVKIYPLKPSDFVNGQISRVFKHARESLLYLLSPGKNARGKGEMYISSANQAVRCVHSLMRLEYFHPEVNVEIIKKNDEGAIEEKAYLRFDSKLTQILTMRPFRRAQSGRKRDRLIGSVFVKNLPPGTTKDTLRVMFPFAQEINYNPEKFKDCTARLVLHYRSHVIPCLKAFAKAELGGNVLELHPLTKRKRTRTDDEMEGSDVKQKRRSEESKKDDTAKKSDDVKIETQGSEGEKKETSKKDAPRESREKSEAKSGEDKTKKDDKNKERKDNKPSQSRRHNRRPVNKPGNQKKVQEQRNDKKPYRPTLVGGKEKGGPLFGGGRGGNQGGKAPARSNKGRQDRPPASSPRYSRETERSREFKTAARRFTNNRNSRSRGSGGGGGGGGSGRQNQGSLGRSSYGVGSGLGMGATMAASDANLAINAEATKEMVLLQNQLSMAIKNQLAMLNQTTMAVEHAKRGASTIGLGSELPSSIPSRSPKAFGAGASSSRRSVDQYRPAASVQDNLDRYDRRGQNRNKSPRRGGGANSGYNKRMAAAAYRDEEEDWGRELTTSQYSDPYRQQTDYVYDREYSGYGASARSYNQDSGYSGYF